MLNVKMSRLHSVSYRAYNVMPRKISLNVMIWFNFNITNGHNEFCQS